MRIHSLQFQNILSWGDDLTYILFDDSNQKIIIKGGQGAGKSSIIEIIYFSIYGKLLRTNTAGVINKYSKANLQTNIVIYRNDIKYEICRYKKTKSSPIVTEIYVNDNLSEIKDSQLEELFIDRDIIGLSRDEFASRCIVDLPIMSSNMDFEKFLTSFYEFDYIDDIGKEYVSELELVNRKFTRKVTDINQIKSQIKLIQEMETDQSKKIKDRLDQIDSEIENIQHIENDIYSKIKAIEAKHLDLEKSIKTHTDLFNTHNKLNMSIEANISMLTDRKLFVNKSKCPYCKQDVKDDHKEREISDIDRKIKLLNDKAATLKHTTLKKTILKLQTTYSSLTTAKNKLLIDSGTNSAKLEMFDAEIKSLESSKDFDRLEKIKSLEDALSKAEDELETIKSRKYLLDILITQVFCEFGYKHELILNKLTDLNKAFDSYLDKFEMDSTSVFIGDDFKLHIYRLGEEFSFDEMSAGEKAIINAIFVLYKISNQKHIGLKIFDETLDDNLTPRNLEIMMELIIDMYKDDTIIFITHKLNIPEMFDVKYLVSKHDSIYSTLVKL